MIAKELRALLPAWAAAACAMVACALVRDLYPFRVPAYFIGAATLGAMAIGHEYSHRTLALMMTQPVARRRVLVTKLSVLAALLFALAMLATITVSAGTGERVSGTALRWLPVVAALFISPYLTMVSRSPVGGAVFTLGLAGVLLIAGEWIGISTYGYTANVDSFRVSFMWRTVLLLSAASAALMWRAFPRLEVLDGRGDMIDLGPRAGTSSQTLTKRRPTWLLVGKELRLQQLAFGLAAIYVVVYVAILIRTRGFLYQNDAAFMLSVLYAGLLALVIGSNASAEERHLRTIDAQLLLPMPTSRQWLIKVSVVLALTFVLAVAMPMALAAAFPPERIVWARSVQPLAAVSTLLGITALATVSLYVSTLCASGLWALMLSVPLAFATATFVLQLGGVMEGFLHSLDGPPDWSIVRWAMAIATVGVIGVVLGLASANHRTADRSRTRIAAHVAIAAGVVVVAVMLIGVAGVLSR